jgi:hypothetical protein
LKKSQKRKNDGDDESASHDDIASDQSADSGSEHEVDGEDGEYSDEHSVNSKKRSRGKGASARSNYSNKRAKGSA